MSSQAFAEQSDLQSAERTTSPVSSPGSGALASNGERQEQLPLDGAPTVDEVLGDGFTDEHLALRVDLESAIGAALGHLGALPPGHAAQVELHLEGCMDLEARLAAAIGAACAAASYAEDGALLTDEDAIVAVDDLFYRVETSVELIQRYNQLYLTMGALDLARILGAFTTTVASIVEAGLVASLEAAVAEVSATAGEVQGACTTVATSMAKLSVDLLVDAAVSATLTTAVPVILARLGLSGAGPALLVGAAITLTASAAYGALSDGWGPDLPNMLESASTLNGMVDLGADTVGVAEISAGITSGAEQVGKLSTALTALLDLAGMGIAVDGLQEALGALEKLTEKHHQLEALWAVAKDQLTRLLGMADDLQVGMGEVAKVIQGRADEIARIESEVLPGLYADGP